MPEAFDPYRKWLGIPPKDRPPNNRPPNHYRLLSLELFEDDADVISNAADRQMAHVRTFQTGPHSDLSQKLLNELSAARVCLLNRERKAEYDAALRREFAAREAAAAAAMAAPPAPLRAAQPLAAPLPTARPIMPTAVIPVSTPFTAPARAVGRPLDTPAAPFVTRYAPRRRGGGWQVPAAAVAICALLAGAAYVVFKQSRPPADGLPPRDNQNVVAKHPPDDSQEKRNGKRRTDARIKTEPTKPDKPDENKPDDLKPPSGGSPINVLPGPVDLLQLPGQVDLLGRIDVDRDRVAGQWKRDAEGVVSPAGGLARLKIPYAVPKEYVVTVEVERLTGDEAFGVGLASGEWWTPAWLDGRKLFPTGLHGIQGSAKGAKTGRLPVGKRVTLGYCVRDTGVVLLQPVNGASASWRGIINWRGDFGSWNWPGSWDAPEKGRLEFAAIKDHQARLETDANDPAANLAVGRFYCFGKKDWDRGLPRLAAGGDPALKELAQRELAKPNGAEEEKSLGDDWWDMSRKEKGAVKAALAGRAGFWYRRALTFLSGIEKEAVEARLEEIGADGLADKTQFLSELTQTNVVVANNGFAKGKNAATNTPLTFLGKESPHGLFTHPDNNSTASVRYDLEKKARRLALNVAIDDGAVITPRCSLVFQVWGDDKLLWSSVPIIAKGQVAGCELNVANVKVLELRVMCAGRSNSSAYAVWLEPRVTWKY
ncbi:MAG TPA: NPCBM/NEW2 domain-containing protein [Pirellulales bacterium]|nr:NPCBM/NEW2 domain-containing protein [Pirellulales bacterium]